MERRCVLFFLLLVAGCSRAGHEGSPREPVAQPGPRPKSESAALAPASPPTECSKPMGPNQPAGPAEMVWIPEGCFDLGPTKPTLGHPPHRACLQGYWMDRTEVTVAQYRACVAAGRCKLPTVETPVCRTNQAGFDTHPASCLTWEDARTFCEWAGKRLPTDAEWERAARGPDLSEYPWGQSDPSPTLATIHRHGPGDEYSKPVCSHPGGHSAEGLCDMAGNVAEWVSDWWPRADGLPEPPPSDPTQVAQGCRVSRGGSYGASRGDLKSWFRDPVCDLSNGVGYGVRCAKSKPAGR